MDQQQTNKAALARIREMMAVAPSQRQEQHYNPLEKIEELLTCPICLDRNPKLLPCQHTICAEPCLEGLIDIAKKNLKCPECRAEHSLPYDGIKAFQTNYTLVGFLEVHLQATEDNAVEMEAYIKRYNMDRCKVCNEKTEVDLCVHCDKRICAECKASHSELIKRDLGRLMNQIKRLSTRITEASDGLSKGMETLTVNALHTKDEIKDYIRRYVNELKKKEARLVGEIETFEASEIRLMRNLRDALELESSNVNEALARVDAFLKGERDISEEELVFYKQLFVDGLDYLRAFQPDADDLFAKKVRFSPGQDANAVPAAILQFGELQICTPQFGSRWQQLESTYAPRMFNVGLESDRYKNRNNPWETNPDSLALARHNEKHEKEESSSRRGTRAGSHIRRQDDTNEGSMRYRRRQQLEEEAWNRLRVDRPGTAQDNHQRVSPSQRSTRPSSPTTSSSDLTVNDQVANAAKHVNKSPFGHINNETSAAASTEGTGSSERVGDSNNPLPAKTGATVDTLMIQATLVSESASGSKPVVRKPPLPQRLPGAPQEDSALNDKIDSIRREHERNMEKRSKQTGTSALVTATASVSLKQGASPANQRVRVDSSSEDDNSQSTDGTPIAVSVYSSPMPSSLATNRGSQPPAAASAHTNSFRDRASSSSKSRHEASTNDSAPNWKKYLIPEPEKTRAVAQVSAASAVRETTPGSGEDDYYTERRRRFTRSKTNPELLFSGSSLNVLAAQSYRSKYAAPDATEVRRNRFARAHDGNDSNESSLDADSNNRTSGADRRTGGHRYRRRADRSNTTLHGVDSADLSAAHNLSLSSSKGSVPVANAIVGGDLSRAKAVIDYKAKAKIQFKFGCKGAGQAEFNWPRGLTVTSDGQIVVCDSSNHRIQIFSKRGQFNRVFGKYGSAPGEFDCLAGVASTKYGQLVITDRYNHRVQVFDAAGTFSREFGQHGQTNGKFNNPWGVVVDHQGFIYVCDKDNHRVQIFQADGSFVGKFGTIGNRDGQFQNPHFIAVNKHNQLIVTDSSNHRVQVFDHNGHFLYSFGQEGFHDGQFKYPRGVAVDEQGFIVVADSGNNRIQVFHPDGRFYCCFGSWGSGDSQLKGVEAVQVTTDGRIIVSDRENHRIQVF